MAFFLGFGFGSGGFGGFEELSCGGNFFGRSRMNKSVCVAIVTDLCSS